MILALLFDTPYVQFKIIFFKYKNHSYLPDQLYGVVECIFLEKYIFISDMGY